MSNIQSNDFAKYLRSLNKDKLVQIFLNNNICILAEPSHFQFFDDHFIYDGRSSAGTMYFPDWQKLYPSHYAPLNTNIGSEIAVPYSAICLIMDLN